MEGSFPLSFRSPRPGNPPWVAFTICNDQEQTDGAGSCGAYESRMRWYANLSFARL